MEDKSKEVDSGKGQDSFLDWNKRKTQDDPLSEHRAEGLECQLICQSGLSTST